MLYKNLCFAFVFCVGFSAAAVPDYIQVCKRSDPQVSKCIKKSVEALRPKLKKGIPELDCPPLDPLRIDDIKVSRGYGNAKFDITLNNLTLHGIGDFLLEKLKLDVVNNIYKVQVLFPVLKMEGHYDVDAMFLSIPIQGSGFFDGNATRGMAVGILKAELVEDNTRLHFASLDLDLQVEDFNLKLDNLFSKDQNLNEAINLLLTQNKKELIPYAIPVIKDKAAEIILQIANNIVKHFTYDEVFPK